jgi:hypothetical protein
MKMEGKMDVQSDFSVEVVLHVHLDLLWVCHDEGLCPW